MRYEVKGNTIPVTVEATSEDEAINAFIELLFAGDIDVCNIQATERVKNKED